MQEEPEERLGNNNDVLVIPGDRPGDSPCGSIFGRFSHGGTRTKGKTRLDTSNKIEPDA